MKNCGRLIGCVLVFAGYSALAEYEDIVVTGGSRIIEGAVRIETMNVVVSPADKSGAELIVRDGATVYFPETNGLFTVGQNSAAVVAKRGGLSTLVISNASVGAVFNPNTQADPYLCETMGSLTDRALRVGGTYGDGVVKFGGNAALTNRLVLGSGGHLGAFYMADGEVASLGGNDDYSDGYTTFSYGGGASTPGLGYFEMLSGTFKNFGSMRHGGKGGNAVFYQIGGTFWMGAHPDGKNVSASSRWELQQSSGRANIYVGGNAMWNIENKLNNSDSGTGSSVFTIDGNAAVSLNKGLVIGVMTDRVNPQIWNLNGAGTLTLPGFTGKQPWSKYYENGIRTKAPTFLNFNGGTLCATDTVPFGRLLNDDKTTSSDYPVLNRVTVYENGGTICKTNDTTVSLYGNVTAATGKGVWSIPLDEPIPGFVAPPVVVIDGDGCGASAQALYDSETGLTTNILVTAHGSDYTYATASLYFGSMTAYKTINCTLQDNVPGALTLANQTHVYGQISTAELVCRLSETAKTLVIYSENGISSNTIVTIAKGTLKLSDMNAVTPKTIRGGAGGKLTAGTRLYRSICPSIEGTGELNWNSTTNLFVGRWEIDAAKLKKNEPNGVYNGNYVAAIGFAETATIDIKNIQALDDPSVKYYVLLKTDNVGKDFFGMPKLVGEAADRCSLEHVGKELRLKVRRGLVLLVR